MLRYRKASLSDREGVVGIISECYGGYDNLPDRYHRYLSPRSQDVGFVAQVEQSGEIVAFLLLVFKDSGHTVVSRAKRVKPHYQGLGIMKRLDQIGHTYLERCGGGHTSSGHTGGDSPHRVSAVVDAGVSPFLYKPRFWESHEVTQRNWFYRLQVPGGDLADAVSRWSQAGTRCRGGGGAVERVRRMSEGEAFQMFSSPESFPGLGLSEVMSGWQCYALHEDNYKVMRRVEEAEFYVDTSAGARRSCCLSVGSHYLTSKGGEPALGYDINLYCACVSHLRSHLLHHLGLLGRRCGQLNGGKRVQCLLQVVLHHRDATRGECRDYVDHIGSYVRNTDSDSDNVTSDDDDTADSDDVTSDDDDTADSDAAGHAPSAWSEDQCKWEVYDLLHRQLKLQLDVGDFLKQFENLQVVYHNI